MSSPSFARATAASSSRASPQRGVSNSITTSPMAPTKRSTSGAPLEPSISEKKKLKRPSTLTKRARESITYNADLYYIRPANRSKPCPLANLPSEIRTQIYSCVFGDLQRPILMNYSRIRHTPPALLHICRAMRIEVAYMYFAEASFTWNVKNLNFSMIFRWLQSLQPSHRALLSRNQHLTIEIFPGLLKSYTYPPKDFLLDDTLRNHWKACQTYGNLYSVKGINHGPPIGLQTPWDDLDHSTSKHNMRMYFIFFCRLAAWARLRNQNSYSGIRWSYVFDMPTDRSSMRHLCETLVYYAEGVTPFLDQLNTLWARNQDARIKVSILDVFSAFIDAITEMTAKINDAKSEKVDSCLSVMKERIEKWGR